MDWRHLSAPTRRSRRADTDLMYGGPYTLWYWAEYSGDAMRPNVDVGDDVVEEVDEYAEKHGLRRSRAWGELVEKGLRSRTLDVESPVTVTKPGSQVHLVQSWGGGVAETMCGLTVDIGDESEWELETGEKPEEDNLCGTCGTLNERKYPDNEVTA